MAAAPALARATSLAGTTSTAWICPKGQKQRTHIATAPASSHSTSQRQISALAPSHAKCEHPRQRARTPSATSSASSQPPISPSPLLRTQTPPSPLHTTPRPTPRRRVPAQASAGTGGSSPGTGTGVVRKVAVPRTVEQSVEQAVGAVKQGVADGCKRQLLELVLPLIGPSLLDDWPGGIQQQLKAATPLMTKLLRGLGSGGSPQKTVLSEEDAVVQWETDQVVLVLFPNADALPALQKLASSSDRAVLLVNPQWQPGQVVSDFGFGAKKRDSEEFLKSFVVTYSLKSSRVRGSDVTIVRSYPSEWCVYVAEEDGSGFRLAGSQPDRPAYKQLESLVVAAEAKSPSGSLGLFDRLAKEFKFLKDNK